MTPRSKVRVDVYDEADLHGTVEKLTKQLAEADAAVESLSKQLLEAKKRLQQRDPLEAWRRIAKNLETALSVRIVGVGTFYPTRRKARRVRNPVTKELMMLPETKSVRFKPSKGGVFG